MDEFGDWIYIILMVVVGISSLFSSINKKKREQQTQMSLPEPLESSDSSYPVPSVPPKKERKLPPPVPGHFKHQPYNAQLTFPDVDTASQTEIYFAQEEESILAGELELADPDDFRKAVIYSEILRPVAIKSADAHDSLWR